MKSSKLLFFISVLLVLFILSPFADQTRADEDNDWTIYFYPSVRFGTNNRILYILDFLIPLYQGEKNIFFANAKFTPNDHDGWETNLGLGYRHLLFDDRVILGLNTFFDFRKTDWGTHHRQWGVGAEVMTEIPIKTLNIGLTGRFNYYYPLSDSLAGGPGGGYFFQGNGIFWEGVEEPMRGLDYEAGVRIPYISDYVETWVYAGGYHYQGRKVHDVNGFMSRIEIIPTDFLKLAFEYRNDNVNHDDYFGEVSLEVPFSIGNLVTGKNPFEGIGGMFSGSRPLSDRLVEPVRRDVDIVIVGEVGGPAQPGDLPVEEIIFISEDAENIAGTRDGTFEHPYASFAEACSDTRLGNTVFTIHVMNDSASGDIPGGTINLANLLIWGSGANHSVYGAPVGMTTGHPRIVDSSPSDSYVLDITQSGVTVMGLSINIINIIGGLLFNSPSSPLTGIVVRDNIINYYLAVSEEVNGIFFNIGGDLGTPGDPILVSNNTVNIISTIGTSWLTGIYAACEGNNYINITGNNVNVSGGNNNYPVYLFSENILDCNISRNTLTLNSPGSTARGIFLMSGIRNNSPMYATIEGNNLSIATSSTPTNAYGFYLYTSGTSGSTIGTPISPVRINNNKVSVGSTATSKFLIYLTTVSSNQGNTVDWSGNTYSTPTGGWTGNYPAFLGEVYENFYGPPWTGNDSITP